MKKNMEVGRVAKDLQVRIRDDFTQVTGTDSAPNIKADAVGNESRRTIAEGGIHA